MAIEASLSLVMSIEVEVYYMKGLVQEPGNPHIGQSGVIE